MPPFSLELEFERPTKTKVRFKHDDLGVIYVPNAVFTQLGRPQRIKITLDAVPALKAVAA
jgi:hypothetical protein